MNEEKLNLDSEPLSAGVAHHDQLAARWTEGYAGARFHRRLALFQTLLTKNVKSGDDWLDLGCGSGVLTRELLDLKAHVVALDGSPAMLRHAQANIGDVAGPPPQWLQGDAQSLGILPDKTFDGVLCSSVVEYLEYPEALLREAARVLRPGGKLILSVPPTWSVVRVTQKLLRRSARVFGRNVFPYLQVSRFELKPARLEQWLAEAGFTFDRATKFDPMLPKGLLAIFRPALLVVEAHRL